MTATEPVRSVIFLFFARGCYPQWMASALGRAEVSVKLMLTKTTPSSPGTIASGVEGSNTTSDAPD